MIARFVECVNIAQFENPHGQNCFSAQSRYNGKSIVAKIRVSSRNPDFGTEL